MDEIHIWSGNGFSCFYYPFSHIKLGDFKMGDWINGGFHFEKCLAGTFLMEKLL